MAAPAVKRGSRQRSAILRVLRDTDTHPTADRVYSMVRAEIPDISLGTVYRNLSALAEDKLIRRLDVGGGGDRFDACCKPHYHLYCDSCKRLMDIMLPYDAGFNKRAEALENIRIDAHELVFHGLCSECCEKQNK